MTCLHLMSELTAFSVWLVVPDAGALCAFAAGHIPSQQALVHAGAVPALVDMLRDCPPADGQTCYAREALVHVLHGYLLSPEALADRTSIPGLISLLTTSSMDLKGKAMAALHQLVLKGNLPSVHAELCAANGIPLLFRMLQCHNAPQIQVAAAGVVGAMAGHSREVQAYMKVACSAHVHLKALYTSPVPAVQEAAITAAKALASV